jgi:hypothetical protein
MAQLQLLALAPLLAEQQGVHQGQPGGLGHALDAPARAEMLRFPEKNRPKDFRDPCEIAPDHPDAHYVMAVFIIRLMNRIIASKYFFKEYEHAALDWLEDQFKLRAAVQFRLVLVEAKRTATTSGIGQNSVLYRALRDMLLAYPAHGVKASITKKKTEQLVWAPNKTVAEIHTTWMEYYEAYDRAVDLTRNLTDVTLIVPEQDWPTRFTEMQAVFPSWVTTIIINYPGRFTSMATCWLAINAEANRQAAGRKSGVNGRIFQLGDSMVAGDMEAYTEELYDEALAGSGPFLCAMGRGVSGCWRCGDKEHLRRDCPQSPSEAEQQGRPMNAWAKMGPRTAAPVRTTGMTSSFPPRGTLAPTQVAQMAMMTERLDRQEAMFEAVLERFSTLVPQGAAGGEAVSASSAGLGIDPGAGAPVMQMAAPLPGPAPLVIGGVQPEGYIYVGMNHGMSVWGHADVVAASVTELNGEPGNV